MPRAPKVQPLPPVPTEKDVDYDALENAERKRRGRASTILAGATPEQAQASRTLLG